MWLYNWVAMAEDVAYAVHSVAGLPLHCSPHDTMPCPFANGMPLVTALLTPDPARAQPGHAPAHQPSAHLCRGRQAQS